MQCNPGKEVAQPSCGISLRHTITRPCPNAAIIQERLTKTTGFNGTLLSEDRVCFACYKSHLVILQEEKKISRDSDLQSLIEEVRQKTCQPTTLQEVSNLAMNATIAHVGKELLQQRAILLPDVHDFFSEYQNTILKASNIEHEEEATNTVTSQWVLSNLTTALQHHLVYACRVKKYGTILYRHDTDLTLLLQQSLSKLRYYEKTQPTTAKAAAPPHKANLTIFLDDLNSDLLDQCHKYIGRDKAFVEDYGTLDVDKEIQDINPSLWNAISTITRSQSECTGRQLAPSEQHKKRLRQYFLLCCMMFCADDRCCMPMHILIADLVESMGGTMFLIQALNKLGVCSSEDTLKRFVQRKLEATSGKHPCGEMFKSSSFTVISVDNIDFVHSYARVFKGTQNSSWHGTTVQLVQPIPSLAPIQHQITSPGELSTRATLPQTEMAAYSSSSFLTEEVPQEVNQPPSRKRLERCSPLPSPLKLTRSPPPKSLCRARTEKEHKKVIIHQPKPPLVQIRHSDCVTPLSCRSINDFLMSKEENESVHNLQSELFSYMLQKLAVAESTSDQPFISIQDYFNMTRATHTETSKIAYLEVMDAISDCKDTQLELLHDLFAKFIVKQPREYLVVEGDQKLFEVLQSLKFEYGSELDWVIPIPGDWHLLMNYQSALMKPYFDAGLKHLAKSAGYPVSSIQTCGQFKRTHQFILEVWEAMYRVMISLFLRTEQGESNLMYDTGPLKALADKLMANKTSFNSETLHTVVSETQSQFNFDKFKAFIQQLARTDSTWMFWIQFVFQDAAAYVGLFLSIRSGDWHLRTGSVKQMAAVFTAFDHPNYLRLISKHLADMLTMLQSVTTMFQQGAFVVSVKGRPWHSVAIDEAHEMLINKSCKMSIVRPSPDHINRIVKYLPFRTKALDNFRDLLFPEEEEKKLIEPASPLSHKPEDNKREQNIHCQIEAINKSGMLDNVSSNRGLFNPFTKQVATTQQSCDLLTFRSTGQQQFLNHIAVSILKQPSASVTVTKHRLNTFSSKKVNKQHVSQLQKDRSLILTCMRKKMKWSLRTGMPISNAGEQLIAFPLALSDNCGNPNKGQKKAISLNL